MPSYVEAMRTLVLTVLALSSVAGAAPAQVFNSSDPYAQSQQYRMEQLRQRSDRIADYSAQYRANTRLTLLEMRQQQLRREEEARLVDTGPRTLEQERAARERATTAREQTVAGVSQIDDWLARNPR